MITAIVFFILGILLGFIFLGSIAADKQRALWQAVHVAAYQNDTSLCKQVVEEYHR